MVGRKVLDHEHDWVEVDRIPWDTQYEDLNKKYVTVVYECDRGECEGKRWSKEESRRASSALDW